MPPHQVSRNRQICLCSASGGGVLKSACKNCTLSSEESPFCRFRKDRDLVGTQLSILNALKDSHKGVISVVILGFMKCDYRLIAERIIVVTVAVK